MRGLCIAVLALGLCTTALAAPAIFVTSLGASEAQIIINKTTVRTLRIGESSPEGVRLLDIRNGTAVFEMEKRQVSLAIGQSTASEVFIRMARDNQFRLTAYINGTAVPAVIDTGASAVSMSAGIAARLGINYSGGMQGVSHTANGSVRSYSVVLPLVQVGDIALRNVPASVLEALPTPNAEVLIGNSFLRYVEMRRDGDTMTLRRTNAF
jgi:aspartyl protease family protein